MLLCIHLEKHQREELSFSGNVTRSLSKCCGKGLGLVLVKLPQADQQNSHQVDPAIIDRTLSALFPHRAVAVSVAT